MGTVETLVASSVVEEWKHSREFYIDGTWVNPIVPKNYPVLNPATEEQIATISLGSEADVDKAVAAATRAFDVYSETTVQERIALLKRIVEVYRGRMKAMAETISAEMGAPISLSRTAQAPSGMAHFS